MSIQTSAKQEDALEQDFQVRRIFSEAEAKEIRELQKGASVFTDNYPGYGKWIDMAVDEVAKGHRVAFGAFKAVMAEDGKARIRLIGSMIIKEEIYGAGVELKNLFVAEKFRKHGVGKALDSAVERHYSKKRYRVIKTEVPAKEKGTISFLLDCGYRVLYTKESAHKAGEYVTEMQKELPLKYGGDCYDRIEFLSWLLENDYNLKVKERSTNSLVFTLEPNHSQGQGTVVADGILLADDNLTPVSTQKVTDFLTAHSSANIKIIYGRTIDPEAKDQCEKHGILVLEEATLLQQFANRFAYKPSSFKIEEVTGTVVVVNGEYFDRVRTVIPNKPFTYFKGGTVGKYLKPNHRVLFLFTSSQQCEQSGVLAYADIVSVQNGTPEEIWEVYKNHNPLFTREEYKSFAENKKKMLALECVNLTWISRISQTDLCSIIGEGFLDLDDLGHLYLSSKMLEVFDERRVAEKVTLHATEVGLDSKPSFGIITALPLECASVECMLSNSQRVTQNARQYIIGETTSPSGGKHVVAVTVSGMGTNLAATKATALLQAFPSVESLIMVGIAGGVPNVTKPNEHVRLGDIVVSNEGGIVQYDFVKEESDRIIERHPPRPPSSKLLDAVRLLEASAIQGSKPWEQYIRLGLKKIKADRPGEASDVLVSSEDQNKELKHPEDKQRVVGQPRVFYGVIGSSNTLLKNPKRRDLLRDKGVKAIEMEASGVADAGWDAGVGILAIRGICDYCDHKKNDVWQPYAAIAAAAYAKALIESMPATESRSV